MQRRDYLRAGGAACVGLALSRSLTSAADEDRSESFGPLGRLEIESGDATEVVVGDDGETAYLGTLYGFATVDIGDPADPELLAERNQLEVDGEPFTQIYDVAVNGDRLAVVGPANEGTAGFHGFELYDVSDPADPAAVDSYETGFHIHNCFLADDLLYVTANDEDDNAVVIYDTSDGVEEVGYWSLLEHDPEWESVYWLARYLHDVYVHDGIAYLPFWDAGTYLVDVSDPSDPEYVSHVRDPDVGDDRSYGGREAQMGLPGNDHYAAVDETGDLLAVGREAWETRGSEPNGPGGIDLYDVSDPADPERRASIDPPETEDASYGGGEWTTAHNFELRDGRLYSAWYQGGVKIHDVSDPGAPAELAHWRETEDASFWTARVAEPGETLVASSTAQAPNTDIEPALYTFPIPDDLEGSETDDGNGSDSDGNDSNGNGDGSIDDRLPGFGVLGAGAGIAGGAAALEWFRRREGDGQ